MITLFINQRVLRSIPSLYYKRTHGKIEISNSINILFTNDLILSIILY